MVQGAGLGPSQAAKMFQASFLPSAGNPDVPLPVSSPGHHWGPEESAAGQGLLGAPVLKGPPGRPPGQGPCWLHREGPKDT